MHLARLVLATLLLLSLAPATTASSNVALTIVVHEGGCGGASTCLLVSEGNLSDIKADANVTVTYRNTGIVGHDLHVTAIEHADPKRTNTFPDDEIAETGILAPGENATLRFVAPANANGVYFWCDLEGHEADGMYLITSYPAARPDAKKSPDLAPIAAIALLATMAIVRRR